MKTRIIIAEDHDFTRQGIVFGLKKHSDIELISEATNGQQAVDLCIKHSPDLILMDIGMPVLSGIEATREIKRFNKNIKVLMFTSHKDKEKVLYAFNSGADAYCTKSIKVDSLVNVIKCVIEGTVWIDPEIAGYVLGLLQKDNLVEVSRSNEANKNTVDYNLTIREKEILKLMSDGLSNKDISEKLVLSLYTVKNHVSNIIKKMAVDDRTQAAVIALKDNLL